MAVLIQLFFFTVLATPIILLVPTSLKLYFNFALNFLLAAFSTLIIGLTYQNGAMNYYLTDLSLLGPLHLKIDELSSIFIPVINFTVLTSSFFSIGYFKNNTDHRVLSVHLIAFPLLHAAMLLVCMTQDLFIFILFWEIVSLGSFALLFFDTQKSITLKTALGYFILMHFNVLLLMIAVAWLYTKTGIQNFEALHFYFNTNSNLPLFLLFFLSFGMRAGFLPLHFWLQETTPSASSPSYGIISGAMMPLGIYGIFRVLMYVETDFKTIGLIVYCISMIAGLYGSIQASLQQDLKKLLAWTSMENTGITGVGIGLGILGISLKNPLITYMGFAGALIHMINHSLFGSLLFYTLGSVALHTGKLKTNGLDGLFKKMPLTTVFFLIGSIALCGLPPFNGFISEFLIYSGMIGLAHSDFNSSWIEYPILISFVLMGILTLVTFIRLLRKAFQGKHATLKASEAREGDPFLLIPNIIIVLLMLAIGLAPDVFIKFVSRAVNLYVPSNSSAIVIPPFDTIIAVGLMGFLFTALIACTYLFRKLKVKPNAEDYNTILNAEIPKDESQPDLKISSYLEKHFLLLESFFTINNKKASEIKTPLKVTSELKTESRYLLYAFLFIAVLLTLTILDIIK